MRIRPTPDGIELRNTPGCMWGVGLWLVAGGTLCLAVVVSSAAELVVRDLLMAGFVGAGVLGGALYALSTWPATRLTMNIARRTLRYVRRAPLRRAVVVEASFDRFRGLQTRVSRDSDGDAWHELDLLIDGSPPLLLGSWPESLKGELVASSRAIGEALRGSRSSAVHQRGRL